MEEKKRVSLMRKLNWRPLMKTTKKINLITRRPLNLKTNRTDKTAWRIGEGDPEKCYALVCGVMEMIDSVTDCLKDEGVSPTRIMLNLEA